MAEKTETSTTATSNYKWKPITRLKDFNVESPENFDKWRNTIFADGLGVRNLEAYNRRDPYTRAQTRTRRDLPEAELNLQPLEEVLARLPIIEGKVYTHEEIKSHSESYSSYTTERNHRKNLLSSQRSADEEYDSEQSKARQTTMLFLDTIPDNMKDLKNRILRSAHDECEPEVEVTKPLTIFKMFRSLLVEGTGQQTYSTSQWFERLSKVPQLTNLLASDVKAVQSFISEIMDLKTTFISAICGGICSKETKCSCSDNCQVRIKCGSSTSVCGCDMGKRCRPMNMGLTILQATIKGRIPSSYTEATLMPVSTARNQLININPGKLTEGDYARFYDGLNVYLGDLKQDKKTKLLEASPQRPQLNQLSNHQELSDPTALNPTKPTSSHIRLPKDLEGWGKPCGRKEHKKFKAPHSASTCRILLVEAKKKNVLKQFNLEDSYQNFCGSKGKGKGKGKGPGGAPGLKRKRGYVDEKEKEDNDVSVPAINALRVIEQEDDVQDYMNKLLIGFDENDEAESSKTIRLNVLKTPQQLEDNQQKLSQKDQQTGNPATPREPVPAELTDVPIGSRGTDMNNSSSSVNSLNAITMIDRDAGAQTVSSKFLLDTGATGTAVNSERWVTNIRPYRGTEATAQTASGDRLAISSIGDMRINILNKERTLEGVMVIPQCKENLISAAQLLKSNRDLALIFTHVGAMAVPLSKTLVTSMRKGTVLARQTEGIYALTASSLESNIDRSPTEVGGVGPSLSLMSRNNSSFPGDTMSDTEIRDTWSEYHVRLGHMALSGFKDLLLRELRNKTIVDRLLRIVNDCVTCSVAKMRYQAPHSTDRPADCLLFRAHSDIGYLASNDLENRGYWTLVVEEYTRFKVCFFTKTMTAEDVGGKLIEILKYWSTMHGRQLREFRSDGGGQFLNSYVTDYLKSVGAVSKPSPAYVQALNGIAEGNVGPLKDMARCLLLTAHFGTEMQSYALQHAVHISNFPIHPFTQKSPYEQWHRRKPDISRLKPFGCLVVVHEPKALRGRLGNKGALGLFLGIHGTDLCRVFLFEHQRVTHEKVVKFFPDHFPGLRRMGLQYRPLFDPMNIKLYRPLAEDIESQRNILESALDKAEQEDQERERLRAQNWGESEKSSVSLTTTADVNGSTAVLPLRERDIVDVEETESRKRVRFTKDESNSNSTETDILVLPAEKKEIDVENTVSMEPKMSDDSISDENITETLEITPDDSEMTNLETIGESTTGTDPDALSTQVQDIDIRTMRNGRWRAVPLINFLRTPMKTIPEEIDIDDYTEEKDYQPQLLRITSGQKYVDMTNLWDFPGPGVYPPRSDIRIIDCPEPPNNMAELYRHPFRDYWISSMQAEMGSIKGMKAFEPRVMPADRKAVPLTWKFKYKSNGQFIARFKARICVRGDLQKSGVDYNPDEIYAPVMRGVTLRVAIAFHGTNRKMWITAGDITTAFLNAKPQKDVYVYDPLGFPGVDPSKRNLLLRSLYGLCQSPKEWYDCLRAWLRENGYNQSKSDPCLFTKKGEDGALRIILVYVDDMLIMACSREAAESMKNMLKSKFSMTDVEDADKVIGVEINRVQGGICLGQPTYSRTILQKSGFWDIDVSKVPQNPMSESWEHDENSGALTRDEQRFFVSYLMMMAWMSQQTRLDLCATTSILAQHLSKPTKSDLAALKWLLKYLRGSWDDVLFYREEKQGELIAELDCDNSFHAKDKPPGFLVGYTDASFGGDPGRKSRTGCVVIARGAAVDWLSKKQSMVALSSTEAEYLSLSQMTQMMAGLRYTLTDLGEEETAKKPSRIYEDNKSCIAIAYKPMHQGRTKHFDIKAHFIRDRIERGEVEVVYCPTGEMIADMLTKALPAKQHQRLKRFAGLYPLSTLQTIKLNDSAAK